MALKRILTLTNPALLPRVCQQMFAGLEKKLAAKGIEIEYLMQSPEWFANTLAPLQGVDAVILRPNDGVTFKTKHLIDCSRPLIIATLSTGTEHLSELLDTGYLSIINSKSGNANAVAEWTLQATQELRRNITEQAKLVARGIWTQEHRIRADSQKFFPSLLTDITWVTVGAGRQVSHLLPLLHAHGVKRIIVWNHRMSNDRLMRCIDGFFHPSSVLHFDKRPITHQHSTIHGTVDKLNYQAHLRISGPNCITDIYGTDAPLADIFPAADVVSVHVPYNSSTKGMINRKAIDSLKQEACVVVASRGGIVDEDALVDAYDSGRILGVAADTVENETTKDRTRSKLWGRVYQAHQEHTPVNIIVTPHIAGNALPDIRDVCADVFSQLEHTLTAHHTHEHSTAQSLDPAQE